MSKKTGYISKIVIIYLLVLIYTVLRYNIFKGVPWTNLPLYVLNKTFALTGIILLSWAFILNSGTQTEQILKRGKQYGWLGFQLILMHMLCSLIILKPLYFSKFFDQGKLNLTGELSMLFGATAFVFLVVNNIRSWLSLNNDMEKNQIYGGYPSILSILFVVIHVFIMGISGWLTPAEWPGYLLPISLICFLILMSTLIYAPLKLKGKIK
jgi:hypothetical protein